MLSHRGLYTPISDMAAWIERRNGRFELVIEPGFELPFWRRRLVSALRRRLRRRTAEGLREAVSSSRPWSDRLATAEALASVMDFGTAGIVAHRLSQLAPGNEDAVAVAVAVDAYHAATADDEPGGREAMRAAVARDLRRMGVPDSTAYRLAAGREGSTRSRMDRRQAIAYAMRRVNRDMDAHHRLIEAGYSPGSSEYRRHRATARRAAARRYP